MVAKPVLTRIWADGALPADVVDPDVDDPGKFDEGWESEIPPYQYFNYLHKLFTQGLAHINERGVAEWDADTQYPANISYATSPVDGLIYRAKTTNTGNEPSASPTHWDVYPPAQATASEAVQGLIEIASSGEVTALSDNTRAVTPAGLSALTPTTSRLGLIELATQTEVNNGADSVRAVTPATLAGRTATQTRAGLIEIASSSEVVAGGDNDRAVSPAGLAALTSTTGRRGLIETATVGEAAAGTDDQRAVTPEGVAAAIAALSPGGDESISSQEIVFSGGARLKYGINSSGAVQRSFNFPSPFPTACYFAGIIPYNTGGANSSTYENVQSFTRFGMTVDCATVTGGGSKSGVSGIWFAIGV